MKNIYKGKLTYTMAVVAIAAGIGGYVAGLFDQQTALMVVWSGLAAFGLRRAIS